MCPNPTSEQLTIDNGQLTMNTITIHDVLGRTILLIKDNDKRIIALNVSKLPSGVYFLTVRSEKFTATKKFVKE